jgi:hypothetical protein
MKRLSRHSWTFVVAIGVLVAAATGATLARPVASTSQITPTQVKRIAKSVADSEISRLAPGLSVKSARTAGSATSANAPALYAQVTSGGAVTTNSQGIVQGNVSHPSPGFYCFSGFPSPPKGGLVTLDTNVPGGGSGPDLAQVGVGSIGRCPAGTQAFVAIFPRDEGAFVDDPFFVVFWF